MVFFPQTVPRHYVNARGAHPHTPSSHWSGSTRSVLSVQCAGMCGTRVEHVGFS
jgi:hypothetical protein